MVGRMRLNFDRAVIEAAVRVEDALAQAYLAPNRTLRETMDTPIRRDGLPDRIRRGPRDSPSLAAQAGMNACASRITPSSLRPPVLCLITANYRPVTVLLFSSYLLKRGVRIFYEAFEIKGCFRGDVRPNGRLSVFSPCYGGSSHLHACAGRITARPTQTTRLHAPNNSAGDRGLNPVRRRRVLRAGLPQRQTSAPPTPR
jgi:hypothetical protein